MEKWLGRFSYCSRRKNNSLSPPHLVHCFPGTLGRQGKTGVTGRFGVGEGIRGKLMIVLLPWKTLGW